MLTLVRPLFSAVRRASCAEGVGAGTELTRPSFWKRNWTQGVLVSVAAVGVLRLCSAFRGLIKCRLGAVDEGRLGLLLMRLKFGEISTCQICQRQRTCLSL